MLCHIALPYSTNICKYAFFLYFIMFLLELSKTHFRYFILQVGIVSCWHYVQGLVIPTL